jgi:hypothetical protein
MSNTNTGGPAFPDPQENWRGEKGMTLRDYFAGQAIAGKLPMSGGMYEAADYARFAYEMADAMLKAREA